MANINTLKNDLAKKETGVGKAGNTIKGLLESPAMKKRFEEVLSKKAPQFMSSLANLVNGDTNLKKVDQMSVIASAMVAATLDLPIDKNLGYAWIVPYGTKAQFQLGYKGYIQLALRTGQYEALNVTEVYEGELKSWNRLTEKLEIDLAGKTSDKVIGYAGYFELINGFKKSVYWTKEEVTKHKNKFSKSDFGWKNDWDAMAKKTVLRNMLSKWGILSIEMQTAQRSDNGVISDKFIEADKNLVITDDAVEFVETDFIESVPEVDPETGEVIPNDLININDIEVE